MRATYDGTNVDDVLRIIGMYHVVHTDTERGLVALMTDGTYVHLHIGDTVNSELVVTCPHR